ncbi:PAS domain-containing protein [Alteromonas sp. AMM-1]|uniref:PAS domain-containing protein n=1 Tax=Alteromonas sp. AMM-1 TaxID=3394233 RepID=UPI0039A56893
MPVVAKNITFSDKILIVSKTDLRGNITYANRHFMRISNFPETALLGKPHNIIRHADMPRGVYYAMWKTLKSRQEFFGFVKNLTSDGDYYWVFANVTPDVVNGKVEGFFSVRRKAPEAAVKAIEAIYAEMRKKEAGLSADTAASNSWKWLSEHIESQHGVSYDEFVLGLYEQYL